MKDTKGMKDTKSKKGKKRGKSKKAMHATAPAMPMEQKEWQARDDLRTLTSAEEIKRDPDRMQRAAKEGRKQVEALTKALQTHIDKNPVKKNA